MGFHVNVHHLWPKQIGEKNLDWTLKSCRGSAHSQHCWHSWRFCHVSKAPKTNLAKIHSQWQLLKISLTLRWCSCQKHKYSSIPCALLDFSSPFFLKDLTEWSTAKSSYFPPKTSGPGSSQWPFWVFYRDPFRGDIGDLHLGDQFRSRMEEAGGQLFP